MKNLFILLYSWFFLWLYFLIVIPLLLFVGILNGLCGSNKAIKTPFQNIFLKEKLVLILFMLFPFFMIPIACIVAHKKNRTVTWSDVWS